MIAFFFVVVFNGLFYAEKRVNMRSGSNSSRNECREIHLIQIKAFVPEFGSFYYLWVTKRKLLP